MRGRKTELTITLTPEERATLVAWQRSPSLPAGLVRRGRIILLVADRVPILHIAGIVGIARRQIYKWSQRFLDHRLRGLHDEPGRGRHRLREAGQ